MIFLFDKAKCGDIALGDTVGRGSVRRVPAWWVLQHTCFWKSGGVCLQGSIGFPPLASQSKVSAEKRLCARKGKSIGAKRIWGECEGIEIGVGKARSKGESGEWLGRFTVWQWLEQAWLDHRNLKSNIFWGDNSFLQAWLDPLLLDGPRRNREAVNENLL